MLIIYFIYRIFMSQDKFLVDIIEKHNKEQIYVKIKNSTHTC